MRWCAKRSRFTPLVPRSVTLSSQVRTDRNFASEISTYLEFVLDCNFHLCLQLVYQSLRYTSRLLSRISLCTAIMSILIKCKGHKARYLLLCRLFQKASPFSILKRSTFCRPNRIYSFIISQNFKNVKLFSYFFKNL